MIGPRGKDKQEIIGIIAHWVVNRFSKNAKKFVTHMLCIYADTREIRPHLMDDFDDC